MVRVTVIKPSFSAHIMTLPELKAVVDTNEIIAQKGTERSRMLVLTTYMQKKMG